MAVVAFVGLGRMGRLMAPHLVAAGHQVRGFDLDPAAEVAGVVRCASAREAARGADVAITMLPSPEAVRAATLGSDGLAEGLAAGSLCVDMSTAPPALSRELASALAPARHRRPRRAGLGRHARRRGRHADDHGRRPAGRGGARAAAVRGLWAGSSSTSATTASDTPQSSATTSAPASTWRPSRRRSRWRGARGSTRSCSTSCCRARPATRASCAPATRRRSATRRRRRTASRPCSRST